MNNPLLPSNPILPNAGGGAGNSMMPRPASNFNPLLPPLSKDQIAQQQKMEKEQGLVQDIQANIKKSNDAQKASSNILTNIGAGIQSVIQNLPGDVVNSVKHFDSFSKGLTTAAIGSWMAPVSNYLMKDTPGYVPMKPSDVAVNKDGSTFNPDSLTKEQKQAFDTGNFLGYLVPYTEASNVARGAMEATGIALNVPALVKAGPVLSKLEGAVSFLGTGQILHEPDQGSRAQQAMMDLATFGVFEGGSAIFSKAWDVALSGSAKEYISRTVADMKNQYATTGLPLDVAEAKTREMDAMIHEETGQTARQLVADRLPPLGKPKSEPAFSGEDISIPHDLTPNAARDNSLVLGSGFDPGVDLFIKEDIKPIGEKIKSAGKYMFNMGRMLSDFVVNTIDPAFKARVNAAIGEDPVAMFIRSSSAPDVGRLMFDNQYNHAFDANYSAIEKMFNGFSRDEQLNFIYGLGDPVTEEGKAIQARAKEALNPQLRDPLLMAARGEIAQTNFTTARDFGMDINDFGPDYFYGKYKSAIGKGDSKVAVDRFMEYWKSTDKFMNEKALPTPADARAFGLELIDANPVTNLRKEMIDIYRTKGMMDFSTWISTTPDKKFAVLDKFASQDQHDTWQPVNDPQLNGWLFHPDFAKVANNILETNKITQAEGILHGIRRATYYAQYMKFFGSYFHLRNELKVALADANFGMFDPSAYKRIGKSMMNTIDPHDPQYIDYIWNGGGHYYSMESQFQSQLDKSMGKWMRGNYIGGTLGFATGLHTDFMNWMFNDFIPYMKFDRFRTEVSSLENSVGRTATAAEKQNIIREGQNFYGELNEKLFGRSATATSWLRLLFTAPGFGEGNFRTAIKALSDPLSGGNKKATLFVINSLISSAVLASVGTRIQTGKWPDLPSMNDPYFSEKVRDLFKIKTNLKDQQGNTQYYDMMTFDKDFWSTYGNALTKRFDKIPGDLYNRVTGMTSSPMKMFSDLTDLFTGKPVVDYLGNKIYSQSDSFQTKLAKFIQYEGGVFQPISASTLESQIAQDSTPGGIMKASAEAVTGVQPTTSDVTKVQKQKKSQLYDISQDVITVRSQLEKQMLTDPKGAVKAMIQFNRDQLKRLKDIIGPDSVNFQSKDYSKYFITNLIPKVPLPGGSNIQQMF